MHWIVKSRRCFICWENIRKIESCRGRRACFSYEEFCIEIKMRFGAHVI